MRRIAFVFAILGLTCGCSTRESSNATIFRYETYWDLHRLTQKQIDVVNSAVSKHAQTNSQVWFALVSDSGNDFDVDIYLRPKRTFGRLYRGLMLSVNSMSAMSGNHAGKRVFCFVAPEGATNMAPSTMNLPFTVAESIPDNVIVSLYEFARQFLEYEDGPIASISRVGHVTMSADSDGNTIETVKASDMNKYKVTTASSRRFCAGRGKILIVDGKTRSGWSSKQ